MCFCLHLLFLLFTCLFFLLLFFTCFYFLYFLFVLYCCTDWVEFAVVHLSSSFFSFLCDRRRGDGDGGRGGSGDGGGR